MRMWMCMQRADSGSKVPLNDDTYVTTMWLCVLWPHSTSYTIQVFGRFGNFQLWPKWKVVCTRLLVLTLTFANFLFDSIWREQHFRTNETYSSTSNERVLICMMHFSAAVRAAAAAAASSVFSLLGSWKETTIRLLSWGVQWQSRKAVIETQKSMQSFIINQHELESEQQQQQTNIKWRWQMLHKTPSTLHT